MPRPRIHVTAPIPVEVDAALRRDFETSDSPEGVDHFDVVHVEHLAWAATRDWLSTRLGA